MCHKTAGALIAVFFTLATAVPAVAAPNSGDACSLLTANQISAVVGAQVGAGTYVTPSFTATCTWVTTGVIVTLMTEGTDVFQAGKTPPSPMIQIVPVSGIGDDAYFVVIQTSVTLYTKKGSVAFKTTVYNSKISNDAREGMEKALATQVASEF